jgi:RHS repeat-associated protein
MKHKLSYCLFLSLSIGLFLGLLPEYAKGQATLIFDESSNDFFQANKDNANNSKIFTARDEIKMKVNASTTSFKATTSNPSYTFKIDPNITPKITTGTTTYPAIELIWSPTLFGIFLPPQIYKTATGTRDSYNTSTNQYTYTIDQSKPVGFIPGNGGVLPTGAASYTIPIDLPAGPGGIKPNLSIGYNSMSGNGLLGWGFNLSGLSAIYRTGQSWYYDQNTTSIQLNRYDKLVKDGVRMLPSSANKWILENDPYTSIKNDFTSNPNLDADILANSFNIEDKSGNKITYGGINNSVVKINQSVANKDYPITWKIQNSSDANGNTINYYYDSNGKHILKITYGVNECYEILFKYSIREDIISNYIAGSKFLEDHLLKSIVVVNQKTIIKEYNLDYAIEENTSKLVQITLKTGQNKFNPTIINWKSKDVTFLESKQLPVDLPHIKSINIGDFNGDGLKDFLIFHGKNLNISPWKNNGTDAQYEAAMYIEVFLAQIDGSYVSALKLNNPQFDSSLPGNKYRKFVKAWVNDYNNDGADDIVFQESHLGQYFLNSQVFGFSNENIFIRVCKLENINSQYSLKELNSVTTETKDNPTSNASAYDFLKIGSFSGNGVSDMIYFNQIDGTYGMNHLSYLRGQVLMTTPVNLTDPWEFYDWNLWNYLWYDTRKYQKPVEIDINGDGKTDIIEFKYDENNNLHWANVSNFRRSNSKDSFGNFNFFKEYLPDYSNQECILSNKSSQPTFADFNGDGLVDVLGYYYTPSTPVPVQIPEKPWLSTLNLSDALHGDHSPKIYLNTGKGFNVDQSFTQMAASLLPRSKVEDIDKLRYFPGDFNGDGRSDILYVTDKVNKNTNLTFFGKDFNFSKINFGTGQFTHHYKLCIFYSDGTTFVSSDEVKFDMVEDIKNSFIKVDDLNRDGKSDILIVDNYGKSILFYVNKDNSGNNRLVSNIVNGFNAKTSFVYDRGVINPSGVYDITNRNVSPLLVSKISPMWLVNKMYEPDGIGGNHEYLYKYVDGLVHRQGKGFLGFKEVYKSYSKTTETSSFNLDLSTYTPYLYKSVISFSNSNSVKDIFTSTNQYQFRFINGISFVQVPEKIVNFDFEKNISNETDFIFDFSNGNLTSKVTKAFNLNSNIPLNTSSTTYKYESFANIGQRVTQIKTEQTLNNKINIRFIDNTFGFVDHPTLPSKVTFDKNTTAQISKDFYYDAFGNILTETTTPVTGNTTSKIYTYYKGKLLLTEQFNNQNQIKYDYDYVKENLTKKTSANGLLTSYEYDDLGRSTKVTDYLGNTATSEYSWASDHTQRYIVKTTTQGRPKLWDTYDILGRKTKSTIEAFGNKLLTTNYTYDNIGKLIFTSSPKDPADLLTPQLTKAYKYYDDGTNRIQSITDQAGILNTFYYEDKKTTSNIFSPHSSKQTTVSQADNALGQLIESTDPIGNSVQYTDFHFNGQPQTIVVNGTQVKNTFDDFGRKTSFSDPSRGTINYGVNALDKLTSQTDARNNITEFKYDDLGRISSQTFDDKSKISFEYYGNQDGAANGLTKAKNLISNSSPLAQNGSVGFQYDNYGRLSSKILKLNSTKNLIDNFEYNSQGFLSSRSFASNVAVAYEYDNIGNLVSIKDSKSGIPLWTLLSKNALDKITKISQGNRVLTDFIFDNISANYKGVNILLPNQNIYTIDLNVDPMNGNVDNRTPLIQNSTLGFKEIFKYDNLDRLLNIKITKSNLTTDDQNINYAVNGNIIRKYDASDLFDYIYDSKNGGSTSSNPINPYAVTQIIPAQSNPTPLSEQNIEYNFFNKVSSIDQAGSSLISFTYNADFERLTMQEGNKLYVYGDSYDAEYDLNGNLLTDWTYISGPSGLVAIYINNNDIHKNITTGWYYPHSDHLGSVLMLTNDKGDVVERYNYDAFGRRRDPITLNYTSVNPEYLRRGFTFHEHLDNVGLINMNGRIYDPVVASFLQADNNIQQATNTQNFNSYSYCLNNPLKYTDPDGEFWQIILAGAIIGGTQNVIQHWDAINGDVSKGLSYFAVGGISGAISATGGVGLINGALTGAFSNFVLSFGNATIEGKGFGQSLEAGISGIAPGLLLGGIAGVAAARVAGLNVINGKPLLGTIAVRAPNIFDYKQTAKRTEEVVTEDVIAEVKDETVSQVSKETEQVLSNESIEVLPEVYTNKLNSVKLTNSEIIYAAKAENQGGLNLFKWGEKTTTTANGWKAGDYMLNLPNKGTPKLNWKANYGALRREMGLGNSIYDSYRLPNGQNIPTGGFLNAERFTLQSRGWIYNPGQGTWLPPIR